MVAVADLERLLERVFERTSARLFRSRLQAVQVERRVERAMEAGRTGRGASTTVPCQYRIRLHPSDLDDLASRSGGFDALAVWLADQALAFARLHAYHLAARPVVSVAADPSVEPGRVEVDASDGAARSTAAPLGPPVDEPPPFVPLPVPSPAVPSSRPAATTGDPDPGALLPARVPPPAPQPALEHGLRAGDRPYAVRPAPPPPSRALLRVLEPGGREREVRVEGEPLTLGRAPDNGLVIADTRVSRHHGRFQTRHGTLVYTDLGSTNGTRVNGIRVDEIVLGPGDRLQIGDVVVVVEQLPR